MSRSDLVAGQVPYITHGRINTRASSTLAHSHGMTTRGCITAMPIREPAGWDRYNEGRLVINGSHPVILLRLVADVTRVVTFGRLGHHVDMKPKSNTLKRLKEERKSIS